MRLRIILPMILLIFTTGCGVSAEKAPINPEPDDKVVELYSDSKNKLIEIESEPIPQQGSVQIQVYNDYDIDYGIKTPFTFIDIIKDNEVIETINTYCYLDSVTDMDCFDFNDDEIKDIAIIGKSASDTTVFLYEVNSHYLCQAYSPWWDVGDFILESLGDEFSLNELKTISSEGLDSYAGMLAKNAISSAEKATYRDYKSAYIDFLKVIDECGVDEHCVPLERYWIYDIDKDLTPELLVLYRDCEANSHVFVYTYTDNKVKNIVEIDTDHSEFFAYPSGNGIMQHRACSGGEEYFLLSLNDNKFTSKELYSGCTGYENPETGDYDTKFMPSRDVVPDAYFLTSFAPDYIYPIEKYEEISANVSSQDNKKYTFPDNDPDFYSEIMEKDGIVNAVSVDGTESIYKDIHFSDFIRAIEYSPSEIHDMTYADLNSDNVYECVFYVSENDNYRPACIIMSKQGDDIFAYYGYPSGTGITKDGFFIEDSDDYSHCQYRVQYDKEKCFYYSAPY